MKIMLKKCTNYAQEICLAYYAQEILLLCSKMCLLCLRNVPIILKKCAYYAQEICLLFFKNEPITLKKCSYYAQEMCQ